MNNICSTWKPTTEGRRGQGNMEGYCRHDAQEVKKCWPSMFPLRVHIQLTHLSWPVLITHSVAKLKMIAVTRFWWAAGRERRRLCPWGALRGETPRRHLPGPSAASQEGWHTRSILCHSTSQTATLKSDSNNKNIYFLIHFLSSRKHFLLSSTKPSLLKSSIYKARGFFFFKFFFKTHSYREKNLPRTDWKLPFRCRNSTNSCNDQARARPKSGTESFLVSLMGLCFS